MKKILILNGPNLNLLHRRDHSIYGDYSLNKISADCEKLAKELEIKIESLISTLFRFQKGHHLHQFV